MKYGNAFLFLSCCIASLHAMYQTTSHDGIVELQRLLKFNRASNCSKRHRVAYDEWIKRQNGQMREINNSEVGPLVAALGFSELPTRTSEVDKRIYEILSKPLFCDQIYKNQEAQEIIRTLARDIIIVGEILKGAITNNPRNVPILTQESFLFSPLSTVIAALVSYITNNIPDISSKDINRVQELISQLLRQAGKEPGAKEMRTKAAQDLTNYLRQTAPLLHEGMFSKGVNRIPTQEEYQYATQILSQNKPFAIPKSINGAIEAWRIRASEFLQSTDYQPERYNDPEIAHLVKSMVEDINSAAAIIKAYLQKKPTQAIIKKSSLVDPRVHDRIKEIIKAIASPADQTNAIDMLLEQKLKIEQLPPEYQQALKQYFNIDERIQKISPTEIAQPTSAPVTETKPEPAPTAAPEQATPAPVSLAPVEPISIKSEEPKPAEPSAPLPSAPVETPAPTEEIKPIGLVTTSEKPAAATDTTASAAPPDQPTPATTQVQPTTTLEATGTPTGTSLREALEKQGQIREIAVGGKATVPSGPVAPDSGTTPSTPAVRSSTPSASSVSQSASAFETPSASSVVETPQPTVPEVAETPSISSTPTVSSAPAQQSQPVNLPTVQSVQEGGKAVRNSLEELRDQLKRMNVQT